MAEDKDRLPAAGAARISGDDYQHAMTWLEALCLLREDGVEEIRFEVGDAEAGIVDDLVVVRREHPSRYAQVKFAVDASTPLTHTWFTSSPTEGARTPLQRFHQAFDQLHRDGMTPEMALITDRHIPGDDPILKHVENTSGLLVPRLFVPSEGSASGVARKAWSEHLNIDEGRLREMLEHLVVDAGRGSYDELLARCRDRMEAVGLRGDPEAVDIGVTVIRNLIKKGDRCLSAYDLMTIVRERGLDRDPDQATMVIEEIEERAWASFSAQRLDWVERFEREQPTAPRSG